jgi:hypothetical protein
LRSATRKGGRRTRVRIGTSLALAGALLIGLAAPVVAGGASRTYTTHLVGELDGVETRATAQAIVSVDRDGASISYRLIAANITDVTMAHIHLAAAPGGTGGIVAWLYPDAPPAALIPGRMDGVLATGRLVASNLTGALAGQPLAALVAALDDGRAYVNVHTKAHPAGEIRGNFTCRMP